MYSARKPYNKLKMSVKDFFTAPVRHLKDVILKESVFEKPYWDGEYPEMHLSIPAPDWPDLSPGGGGGGGAWEEPQDRWCFVYCDPTFDCVHDPVEIHSAVFTTNFPREYSDCSIEAWADPGEIINQGPGQWLRLGPSIAVWVNPSIERQTVWGRMVDGVGHECFCHITVECDVCDCATADPFAVDEGNTDDTIAPNDTAVVTVTGGCGPYHWSVAGTGYSISPNGESENLVAVVSCVDGDCGDEFDPYCIVTITDDCDTSIEARIRNTDGQWTNTDTMCGENQSFTAGCTGDIVSNRYRYYLNMKLQAMTGCAGDPCCAYAIANCAALGFDCSTAGATCGAFCGSAFGYAAPAANYCYSWNASFVGWVTWIVRQEWQCPP